MLCASQVRKERKTKEKQKNYEAKVHAKKAARGKIVGKPGQRVRGGVSKGRPMKGGGGGGGAKGRGRPGKGSGGGGRGKGRPGRR